MSLAEPRPKQLTIALNRGRILKEFLPMMAAAGIEPTEDMGASRKLVFDTVNPNVRVLVARGSDVPTYVEHGAADIGITGKDTILEHGTQGYYERLDLGIARCRLMTAAPAGFKYPAGRVRVATKFVRIAERYFAQRGQQATIIPLSGALEVAPVLDLADLIVDIVDTGNTLKANGLVAMDSIAEVSTRVIVNRAAMKLKFDEVTKVLTDLSEALKP
ncbi:MAG: ATP phosphoribosyltransferase [Pseudomonadaceae bacterium]|nr:ATP phosphoribosyltransferase [Pseudomonadaceae bacterium]